MLNIPMSMAMMMLLVPLIRTGGLGVPTSGSHDCLEHWAPLTFVTLMELLPLQHFPALLHSVSFPRSWIGSDVGSSAGASVGAGEHWDSDSPERLHFPRASPCCPYLALAWIKDTAGSSMLFYLLLSMYRFKWTCRADSFLPLASAVSETFLQVLEQPQQTNHPDSHQLSVKLEKRKLSV